MRTLQKINKRFENAKFNIGCYRDEYEIGNKEITTDDVIIVMDICCENRCNDHVVVYKKPNKKYIYYIDVIESLIEKGFERGDYRMFWYLENLNDCTIDNIKVFTFSWE